MKALARLYREQIILQRCDKIPDGMGGFKTEWVTVATVGARLRNPRVKTAEETGAVQSVRMHEIRIRNRPGAPDIRRGWRVLWGTKTISVEDAYYDDYDGDKVLICRETVK